MNEQTPPVIRAIQVLLIFFLLALGYYLLHPVFHFYHSLK